MKKSPTDVVNKLLEAEDDVDPKAYMMALRRKRDVVQELIKRYAVRHRWDYDRGERVAVTFPKDLDFKKLLADHGVPCANVMGISGGNKNHRLQFYWNAGELDGLINESLEGAPERGLPDLPVEDLLAELRLKLSMQDGFWQWHTDAEGRKGVVINGHVHGVKTSGEARRAADFVLGRKGVKIDAFEFDEDDREMTIFLAAQERP